MAASPRFPSPPDEYEREWANQYTRLLEQSIGSLLDRIQTLQDFVAPSMTTADRTLITGTPGQIVYDTDIAKLFVWTTAWEEITSV
jgi:hypothetical protein